MKLKFFWIANVLYTNRSKVGVYSATKLNHETQTNSFEGNDCLQIFFQLIERMPLCTFGWIFSSVLDGHEMVGQTIELQNLKTVVRVDHVLKQNILDLDFCVDQDIYYICSASKIQKFYFVYVGVNEYTVDCQADSRDELFFKIISLKNTNVKSQFYGTNGFVQMNIGSESIVLNLLKCHEPQKLNRVESTDITFLFQEF